MKFRAGVLAGLVSLLVVLSAWPARAQTPPPGCIAGELPSHALALICVPPGAAWNRQLVVYAPGYTPPQLPLGFYYLKTPGPNGVLLSDLVQSLGYAFATTSYRKNGLAILEGVDDVRELVAAFPLAGRGLPTRTHVAGGSEGGLVATLLAERSPELFSSALAACAPIGSFRQQINYVGDFRVLFEYYFAGVVPGSVVDVPAAAGFLFDVAPPGVIPYKDRIAAALVANPAKALELMRVARVAHDPANFLTVINSAVNLLRYTVVGTFDLQLALGGPGNNAYSNRGRWYFGSSNDLRLNLLVGRYTATPAALAALVPYETDGDLSIPLVTIHTTADEVAPFAHELLYLLKVDTTGRGAFLPFPVARYGHCNFTAQELGLSLLFTANLP